MAAVHKRRCIGGWTQQLDVNTGALTSGPGGWLVIGAKEKNGSENHEWRERVIEKATMNACVQERSIVLSIISKKGYSVNCSFSGLDAKKIQERVAF